MHSVYVSHKYCDFTNLTYITEICTHFDIEHVKRDNVYFRMLSSLSYFD